MLSEALRRSLAAKRAAANGENYMALATRIDVARSTEAVLSGKASDKSAAFDDIYNHYRPRLVSFAARRGAADPEGAADLALFDTFRAAPTLTNRTEQGFRAYLYRALRSHTAADLHHKSRFADPIGSAGEVEELVEAKTDPAFSSVDGMWLGELVEKLPVDQRSVVELRFGEDLSGSETARRLERSPDAVYQLQHRALRRLRVLIAAAGCVILLALTAVAIRATSTRVVSVDPVTTSEPGPADGTPAAGDDNGPTLFVDGNDGPRTTTPIPERATEGRLQLAPPAITSDGPSEQVTPAEPSSDDGRERSPRAEPAPVPAAPAAGPDAPAGTSTAATTTVPSTAAPATVEPTTSSPTTPQTTVAPAGEDLRNADFTGQDLTGRNFRNADLRGADFNRADLTGADLRDAKLDGADFNKANLTGADLRGADLGSANFTKSNLTEADLRGASTDSADFNRATLTDTKADGQLGGEQDERTDDESERGDVEWGDVERPESRGEPSPPTEPGDRAKTPEAAARSDLDRPSNALD